MTCTTRCDCPLDGESAHWDDDVLQVVEASIAQTMREEHLSRGAAIRLLTTMGVAGWGCPPRQAHRRAAWEAAVLADLSSQWARACGA